MFGHKTRIVVIAACVLLAIRAAVDGAQVPAGLFAMAAAFYLAGLWRNGPVWLAVRKARRGDLPSAEALLNQIKSPERLGATQRPYYYYLRGVLEQRAGNVQAAELHFRNADSGRLRTSDDRALVKAHLAELALQRGERELAATLLESAKSCDPKGAVAEVVLDLEHRLTESG